MGSNSYRGEKCINKIGPVPGTWEALTLYQYSSTSTNTRSTVLISSFPEVLLTIWSLKELPQTQWCTFRFILYLSFIRKHEMNLLNCFFYVGSETLLLLLADSEVACKYYFHRHTSSNLVIVGNLRLSKYLHFLAHC